MKGLEDLDIKGRLDAILTKSKNKKEYLKNN